MNVNDPNTNIIVRNPNAIEPRNNQIRPIDDRRGYIIHNRIMRRANPAYIPGARADRMGFRPGSQQLYSAQRSQESTAQKSVLPNNPKSPWTIIKPLMPNILDQQAADDAKRLGQQRVASGHKWAVVQQR